MEFKEFEPRFKSAKIRFKFSAGLNLETFDTILMEPLNLNHRSNSLNSATGLIKLVLNHSKYWKGYTFITKGSFFGKSSYDEDESWFQIWFIPIFKKIMDTYMVTICQLTAALSLFVNLFFWKKLVMNYQNYKKVIVLI